MTPTIVEFTIVNSLRENKRNVNTKRMQVRSESMIDSITILGLIAATFTTVCLLPQLMKVWKTKSTKDISAGMYMLYGGGVFLWLMYGLYRMDIAIITANFLAFIQAIIVLMFKAKYK